MERKCLYCGCSYSSRLSSCPNCGGGLTAETYHMDSEEEREEGIMEIMGDKLKELLSDKRVLAVLLVVAVTISGISIRKRVARFWETVTTPSSQSQTDESKHTDTDTRREQPAENTVGSATGETAENTAKTADTTPTPKPVNQSYELGMAYLNHGDYEKAIRTLSQVSTASDEYADAQIALLTAVDYYRADALQKADTLNGSGDYEASIKLLRNVENLTGFSVEVAMRRETAEDAYFENVVDNCKAIYKAEGAEKASVAVNDALSVLTNDSRLLKLKALLDGVTVVSEKQVTRNRGYATSYDYTTDSYGNEHDGELLRFGVDSDLEYTPHEKYNSFAASIFVGEMYEYQRIQLRFYCDGKLVYDTGMVDRKYRGETLNIDITGVYSFRIEAEGVGDTVMGSYRPNIWLENAVFSTGITEADIDRAIQ